MPTSFRGVIPAMVTPMTAKEEVSYALLETLVDDLIDAGVHGLIALGSTGEFYALTPDERREVLATVIAKAAGRVPVIAGVNAASTREVLAYSREAEAHGAAGLLVAPPFYSLPQPDELIEHFRLIDRAVNIPIMLYNFPGRTGVDMKPELIEKLAKFKNVRYVKESTGETARLTEIMLRCGDKLGVFAGGDTVALESLSLGVCGWVAGLANVCPREHVELFDLVTVQKDLDAARKLFHKLYPLFALAENGGKYAQFVKAACKIVGRDVGPPRRPLLPATATEVAQLRAACKVFRTKSKSRSS
jgi:4-hydroxy-tetrahydrodipicolinate synthase